MNNIDKDYLSLCRDILDNGVQKNTRNGKVISVFGRQIRHKMSDGFPLLTTKKMAWKSIVTELLWFLRGDTNIKFLLDNDCHIWDGDCFANYVRNFTKYVDSLPEDSETEFIINKDKFINKIKTDDEFAKKWGELGPIYGKQWRKWNCLDEGFTTLKEGEEIEIDNQHINISHQTDQIANLVSELKTNPDSRRLMVSAWNVGELDEMVLPPCHYGFQVYTRELSLEERRNMFPKLNEMFLEKKKNVDGYDFDSAAFYREKEKQLLETLPTRAISLMWNQRSVDVPLGLPFNIASYGLLLHILAEVTNMIPDELIGNLGDCHIYENQIDGIKEQLSREPFELPSLNINTEWWPTIGGSCGEGPLDAIAVMNSFKDENFCKCLLEEDIQLGNYKYHPTIKMPLSN